MKYCVVILAGGKSSRMGKNKAFLELEGVSFVDKLAEELKSLGEVFLSVDDEQKYQHVPYKLVLDLFPECGPMGGIYSSLLACDAEALIVVSCDTPFLSESIFRNMCYQLDEETDAVISMTQDDRIHPLCGVYKKTCLPRMKECLEQKTYKMRAMLSSLSVTYYETGEESWRLKNVNTPDDYSNIISTVRKMRA